MLTTTQERELKRHWATEYMEDLLYEHLLASGVAAKSADLATALEQVGIKVDPKFIRLTLVESKRFIVEDRRWNIALRGEIRRPFVGLVEFAMHNYGKPIAINALHNEMALVMRRPLEFFEELLSTTLNDQAKYFQTGQGEWGLREWLFDTGYSDEAEIMMRNFFFLTEEVQRLQEGLLAGDINAKQAPEQLALELLQKAGRPVSHKMLSFLVWKVKGEVDSEALFNQLRNNEQLLMVSESAWGMQEWQSEWVAELKKLSKKAETKDDLPWLEDEAEEGAFEINEQDIKETIAFVKKQHRAVRMREILEKIFEIPTSSVRWELAAMAVTDALAHDGRLQRVGAQSWTLPSFVPKVDKLPRGLAVEPTKPQNNEVDAELDDEGLEPGLAAWIHDPRYEEVGEAEEAEVSREQQAIDEARYVATHPHLKAGTLKLRKMDMQFYPSEADPAGLQFHDQEINSEVEVWANRRLGMLLGLDAWYEERDLQPGAIFTVTRGEEADDYILHFTGEMDPLMAISPERMKILRSIKKEATEKDWPIFEIMCRIMADYDKGVAYMTLWAEVNVVRRTRKRTVASNLSSYHCFTQRPAGTDNWMFDERRVSLGRKKTKRQYMRTPEQQ